MSKPGLLARLGLDRPELRAWAMYDWANSAFLTVVVTAVFPSYYKSVLAGSLPPATSTARYAWATTLALVIAAILAPPLGRLADLSAAKLRLLRSSLIIAVLATAGLFFTGQGEWRLGLVLFVVSNAAASASFVFYDALLAHVARPDEIDRVSSAGYALGYIGGGLMLLLSLVLILKPALFLLPSGPGLSSSDATLPARLSFLLTALWWAGFSIPLFRRVREPQGVIPTGRSPRTTLVADSFLAAGRTLRDLRGYPQALLLLVAFMLYNDGIQTIIRMAVIYGEELGIDQQVMIGAIVMVQFVGIPFAFLFGMLAEWIGTKPAIFLGLAVYVAITVLGYQMTSARDFVILAALVGMVQGGTQALSRSLFASMIPKSKSGEFFGFFAIFEKFAGILGPLFFSLAVSLTGSSRAALLSVIVFFVAGALLLARVDVAGGRRQVAAER